MADLHAGGQRLQLQHDLLHRGQHINRLQRQGRRPLLQACVGQNFVNQLVQLGQVTIHAVHVTALGIVAVGSLDHLQAKAQPRHRRAQLVRYRANHLLLNLHYALQVFGHVVEGTGQTAHRVGADHLGAGIQVASGNVGCGRLQVHQPLLQLTHQQVDEQTAERQRQQPGHQQHLRRILLHLIDRPQAQHPVGVRDFHVHHHRVAVRPQTQHGVELIQPPPLVNIQIRLVQTGQIQRKAKALGTAQLLQPARHVRLGVAHQLIGNQKQRRAAQLLGNTLDIGSQHLLPAQIHQAIDSRLRGPLATHQHTTLNQPRPAGRVQRQRIQRVQLQRHADQPHPHRHGLLPLGIVHGFKVVGHQPEGTGGDAFAKIFGAHIVDHADADQRQAGDGDQHQQHAAVNAQKNRVHAWPGPGATNR